MSAATAARRGRARPPPRPSASSASASSASSLALALLIARHRRSSSRASSRPTRCATSRSTRRSSRSSRVGQTLVIITRNVDLSVGSVLGLSAFLAGDLLSKHPGMALPLVFVLGIALGAACGAAQRRPRHVGPGAGARRHAGDALRLPRPGVPVDERPPGQRRDAARRVPQPRHRHRSLGVPNLVLIALVVVVVVGQWLRDFRAGRELYAIGSNPEGARLAGVRSDAPRADRLRARRRAGRPRRACCSPRASRTVDATAGTGYELTVIAAAVVGGVAIFGGTGSVYGAALGALLLQHDHLVADRPAASTAFWQQAAIGALLLIAIAFDRFARPARRGRPAPKERAPCRLSRRRPRRARAPTRRAPARGLRALAGRWETLLVGAASSSLLDRRPGALAEFLTERLVHHRLARLLARSR